MKHRHFRSLVAACVSLAFATATDQGGAAEPKAAEFFRGLNLNGPPVVIDEHDWEGADSPNYATSDQAFENQSVELIPPTDAARAQMIRSSRWNTPHFELTLLNIPEGDYHVFAYVWEDNDPQTFSVALDGREVEREVNSGRGGTWQRLGPWEIHIHDGDLRLTSEGGCANFSGIELWRLGMPTPPLDPAAAERFDKTIAPLLAKHCLECHGGSEKKGGLVLTDRVSASRGGESGAVLVAGKPEESLVWMQVESDEMPKDRPPLTDAEKQTLREWIADGAVWSANPVQPLLLTTDRRAGYDWWSLQPIQHPAPPEIKEDWARNEIDAFIFARLQAGGLPPAAQADARTLIRRLYFDLIGLPPEPEEITQWTERLTHGAAGGARLDEAAYRDLVEHLLDSPHYGERWARHWLDVVRFGETQGFERNKIRDNAWRYRDWVVDAFNRDLPYNEFVRLQIAGDVLYAGDRNALIATGYHVIGAWDQVAHYEGSGEMRKVAREDHLEDLVGALGQTFLGLTTNCARCHDHKFDPISQKEYYQLEACLAGVNQEEKEREIEGGPVHAIIPKEPSPTYVLERGDLRKPKGIVSPAGLKGLAGLPADFGLAPGAPEAERRVKLAEWLADTRNPLTPRVLVNRIWHYHFGQGIVDTPSDFGWNGGRPSHPEMLDWLASEFIARGWSVKEMHRLIVTSATYRQQSNVVNEQAEGVDKENHLLWRANRRRLEGEVVRDAALAASGALNRQIGGPSYRDIKLSGGVMGTNAEFTDPTGDFNDEVNRRTIYRLWARQGTNPLLDSLDCPDPSVMAPRRTQTITPVQALSLLNSRFAEQCAIRFAERVRRDAGGDVQKQVERTYALAFARPPKPRELELGREFVGKRGLEQLCLVLLNTNEFLFVE